MPPNPLRGLYEMRRRDLAMQSLLEEGGISRREVLRRGAVIGAGALAGPGLLAACGDDDDGGGGGRSSEEITLLTWDGYHAETWLQDFEKKTGIKVNATNVGSPAEMFSKVRASPDQYDIILNTSGWFDQYVASDLIVPIDESRIPNVKEISNAFPWRDATSVDGTNYGILYTWGASPIGWNADEVPGNVDISRYVNDEGVPDDWNIFWDPGFAGKVSIFDDPTSVEPMISLALGQKNPYKLSDAQFEEFRQYLFKLRPQVKHLTTGYDDQVNTFVTGEATIGYINHDLVILEVNKKGVPLEANHIVRQGVPAWSDNTTITKAGADKEDAVYEFINTGISLPWQARLIETTGNSGTLSYDQAVDEGLTKSELEPTLIPQTRQGDAFFDVLQFFQAFEDLDKRLEVWNEFKLGIGA
jgi:spermidine/putrescine-binding protein